MKNLLFVITAVFALGLYADDVATTNAAPKKSRKEISRELFNKRTGGLVPVPGAKQGKIVFVNCQKSADVAWVKAFAESNKEELKVDIEVIDGVFALPSPTIHGNASLYIIEDTTLPSLLLAPENRWVMMNVAPLKTGNGSKPTFLAARVKKELARAFAMLCGATSSNYPGSLTGCIVKPEQLDKFADNQHPVDIAVRYPEYLAGYGIKPNKFAPYKKACKEGWAPEPTNDVQKAIWDDYHAKPTEPMRIKFDPTKGE